MTLDRSLHTSLGFIWEGGQLACTLRLPHAVTHLGQHCPNPEAPASQTHVLPPARGCLLDSGVRAGDRVTETPRCRSWVPTEGQGPGCIAKTSACGGL